MEKKLKKEGYVYTKRLNKKVIDELLNIRNKEGLNSKNVLKNAKNKRSPLNPLFEWDNNKASEKYREYQALQLINEVKVIIKGQLFNGFENVKIKVSENGYKHFYEPAQEILKKSELRKQIVQKALTLLESWRIQYEIYAEFKGVVKEIEKIKKEFRK